VNSRFWLNKGSLSETSGDLWSKSRILFYRLDSECNPWCILMLLSSTSTLTAYWCFPQRLKTSPRQLYRILWYCYSLCSIEIPNSPSSAPLNDEMTKGFHVKSCRRNQQNFTRPHKELGSQGLVAFPSLHCACEARKNKEVMYLYNTMQCISLRNYLSWLSASNEYDDDTNAFILCFKQVKTSMFEMWMVALRREVLRG
jgi:hypothetical protein